MGLPGSGKTFLAKKFSNLLKADWFNADKIRKQHKDWDFSKAGIIRQVRRMKKLTNESKKKYVIADFVCPLPQQIKIFKPNIIIWMNTIVKSRYPKMNKIFVPPKKYDFVFKEKNIKINILNLKDKIIGYKWNNKNPTIQMLGRFQPWHYGHRKLFEKCVLKTGQVNIMVKDMNKGKGNPYSYLKVKNKILNDLKYFRKRIQVSLVPNITEINYGRTVGYKIKRIKLGNKIEQISATKIRNKKIKNKLLFN